MAKKKQKMFHYVLVMTNNGPVFITEVNNDDRTAMWEKDKKPYAFYSIEDTQYVAMGLTWHGTTAYPISVPYELTNQPYNYPKGEFKWEWNKDVPIEERED